jgi:hypothetical protein
VSETVNWDDVEPLDVVLSAVNGQRYLVLARIGGKIILKDEGGAQVSLPIPSGSVKRVSAMSAMRDAQQAATLTLGALPLCPPDYDEPAVLLAHLYVLHGMSFEEDSDVDSMAVLTKRHNADHDNDLDRQHRHDPAFERINAADES